MPTNHRTSFAKKCSDDPAARQRTPGCSVRASETKFEPHPRTKMKIGVSPSAPSLNEVSAPKKEYSLNPLNVSNEPVIKTDNNDTNDTDAGTDNVNANKPTLSFKSNNKRDNQSRLTLPMPRLPKEVTKFTEAMGAKGKLINVSYHLDAVIQDEIEESLISSDDLEGRRYKEMKFFDEEYTEGIMEQAGLSEWKIDPDLSTKQHLVLSKGNQTQVFFRGRAGNQDPIQGPEGLPRNKLEKFLAEGDDRVGVDTRHVMDTLQNKERDYGFIDELYENIKEKYPSNELEVISYSNGGPKGLHMSEKYGIKHTMMDGVLGPKEVNLLKGRTNASAALEMIRPANAPALASGMGLTKYQMISGQTAPPNTKLTNIETYEISKMPLENAIQAHDPTHFSGQEANFQDVTGERVHIGRTPGLIKGAAASFLPAIAATALVEGIAPDQNEHLKLGEIAALTGGMTQGIAPLIGAGGASMAEMALPLYASMEAAGATSRAVDSVLPEDMNSTAKGGIEGTAGGAAGGATFAGASAAQTAVVNVARSALASTAETASAAAAETAGVEMATMGTAAAVETAELTGLAAAEAGLLTATEVTGTLAASEAGLNPVLDALFIATAFGAGVGGLIGLISGATSQNSSESEQEKEYRLQREAFARADAAYTIEQHRLQMEENARQKATEERGSYIEYIKHKGSKFQDQGIKAQGDTVREALESYDKNVNLPGYDPYRDLYAETAVERNEMKAMNLESEDSLEIMNSANSDTLSQTVV